MLSPDLAEEGDAGDVADDVDDADEDPNEDDDEEESRQGMTRRSFVWVLLWMMRMMLRRGMPVMMLTMWMDG